MCDDRRSCVEATRGRREKKAIASDNGTDSHQDGVSLWAETYDRQFDDA
jgi:TolB-like protein